MQTLTTLLKFIKRNDIKVIGNVIYYKDYEVTYPNDFHEYLQTLTADFRTSLDESNQVDFLKVYHEIANAEVYKTWFFEEEIRFAYHPNKSERELPSNPYSLPKSLIKNPKKLPIAKVNDAIERNISFIEQMVHIEVDILHKLRNEVFNIYNNKHKIDEDGNTLLQPKSLIEWNGDQLTLAGLFSLFQNSNRLKFNYNKTYHGRAAEKNHLMDFLIDNFIINSEKLKGRIKRNSINKDFSIITAPLVYPDKKQKSDDRIQKIRDLYKDLTEMENIIEDFKTVKSDFANTQLKEEKPMFDKT